MQLRASTAVPTAPSVTSASACHRTPFKLDQDNRLVGQDQKGLESLNSINARTRHHLMSKWSWAAAERLFAWPRLIQLGLSVYTHYIARHNACQGPASESGPLLLDHRQVKWLQAYATLLRRSSPA